VYATYKISNISLTHSALIAAKFYRTNETEKTAPKPTSKTPAKEGAAKDSAAKEGAVRCFIALPLRLFDLEKWCFFCISCVFACATIAHSRENPSKEEHPDEAVEHHNHQERGEGS
jgi:hypothetical protein